MCPPIHTHRMRLRIRPSPSAHAIDLRPSSSSHGMHLRSYTNQSRTREVQNIGKQKRQHSEEDFKSLAPATRKRHKRMPKFTLFPMLPAELRLMVWEFAIVSKPRSIRLYADPPENIFRPSIDSFRVSYRQSEFPPLLHVNHECQELSSQIYTKWTQIRKFSPYNEEIIYINPAVDILHITYRPRLELYVQFFKQHAILRTLKHLAVSLSSDDGEIDRICDFFPDLDQTTIFTHLDLIGDNTARSLRQRSCCCRWTTYFKRKWKELRGNRPLPKLMISDSKIACLTSGRAVPYEMKWDAPETDQLMEIAKFYKRDWYLKRIADMQEMNSVAG
jgi:hypothetical protein